MCKWVRSLCKRRWSPILHSHIQAHIYQPKQSTEADYLNVEGNGARLRTTLSQHVWRRSSKNAVWFNALQREVSRSGGGSFCKQASGGKSFSDAYVINSFDIPFYDLCIIIPPSFSYYLFQELLIKCCGIDSGGLLCGLVPFIRTNVQNTSTDGRCWRASLYDREYIQLAYLPLSFPHGVFDNGVCCSSPTESSWVCILSGNYVARSADTVFWIPSRLMVTVCNIVEVSPKGLMARGSTF